jgi:hypothetical protein
MMRSLIKSSQKNNVNFNTKIEPDCLNNSNCQQCIDDPKCVWCGIEGKCKSGDMSGPYDGSCNTSFNYSRCS